MTGESGRLRGSALAMMAGAAALTGCVRQDPPTAQAPQARPAASDYAAPPELDHAIRGASGMVTLSGSARPDSAIRLASPDGSALTAAASQSGRWTLSAPAGPAPRLYSLSEVLAGRPLRARGYLAALPWPATPAALLRPGAAAEPLAAGPPRFELSAVDFDRSGAGVVAGLARPGDVVRVELDGTPAGEGRANASGVFTVPLSPTLQAGPHRLTAVTSRARESASFDAAPAGFIARPPFTAARLAAAWRIDWITPGGGVQTSILFDPKENRA